jgi:integrase
MTPRHRSKKNRDLPDNLYTATGGYIYRHPVTGKNHGAGSDRAEAIKAANALNRILVKQDSIVNRVLGTTSLSTVLNRFRKEFIADQDHSKSYDDQIDEKLRRIERELGKDTAWESIDLKMLSDWMAELTRDSYVKYRTLLVQVYDFACSVGLSPRNIADLTIVKKPPKKVRKRWSLETYQAVYAHAEPWLQVAMDFALTSLQRRIDLTGVHKKRDIVDGRILVMQVKTKKRIAIRIGGSLEQVIARAKQLHPFCPFVIGHKPERARKSPKNPKEHPYQVTTDYLTKAVAAVRDASGVFKDWPAAETPTLHELRSLGAHLYQEAGYPVEYIQALLGHADAKMTELYLSGYGEKWQEVRADLPLKPGA